MRRGRAQKDAKQGFEKLDGTETAIEKQWTKETLHRQKEMRLGKIKALSHEDVFKKYGNKD